MMLAMERTARQWIKDELVARRVRGPFRTEPPIDIELQLSPVRWVLPKLLQIVYQNTDQPVAVLAPLIRAMLREQAVAAVGVAPCGDDQLDESINETVALLVKVLERVRRQCMIQPRLA